MRKKKKQNTTDETLALPLVKFSKIGAHAKWTKVHQKIIYVDISTRKNKRSITTGLEDINYFFGK